MAYYKTCSYCGANLDPGEKCDCQEREASPAEGEFVSLSEREIKKGPQVREHRANQKTIYITISLTEIVKKVKEEII